ncbi:MAG: tetratricopeptide repeat protein [Acidobacteria bacterium]|nr:tetratricopeptide repeat protein [Acidobacteriota bacterium]
MTMNENSRLKTLQGRLSKNPQDIFSWYGLAMEYKSQGRFAEAIEAFKNLIERDPHYCAAYYQYGAALAEAGDHSEAEQVLNAGIQVAEKKGDWHTVSELQAALSQLHDQRSWPNSP